MKKETDDSYELIFKLPKEVFLKKKTIFANFLTYTYAGIMFFVMIIVNSYLEIEITLLMLSLIIIFGVGNATLFKKEKFYFSWIKRKRSKSIKEMETEIRDVFYKKYNSEITLEKYVLEAIFEKRTNLEKLSKNKKYSPFITASAKRLERIRSLEKIYFPQREKTIK